MKKKIFVTFVFLLSAIVPAFSQDYSIPNTSFRSVYNYDINIYGDKTGAVYCGNTSQGLTGYKVHSTRWSNCISKNVKNLQGFTGKMSKAQSQLIKDALDQFELDVGDIYSVGFYKSSPDYYGITVEITKVNSDGSYGYSWWGFLYSDSEKHPDSWVSPSSGF